MYVYTQERWAQHERNTLHKKNVGEKMYVYTQERLVGAACKRRKKNVKKMDVNVKKNVCIYTGETGRRGMEEAKQAGTAAEQAEEALSGNRGLS